MNISSNNLRGLSQYSLLNKLFSQKNGNKTSTSNQMGAAISGGVVRTSWTALKNP